ncbi:hypothetical protein PINS_up006620 [Pythium insidiosum]|nr:hypothetical protein PINS_up006620 [Pythium insidiosum]
MFSEYPPQAYPTELLGSTAIAMRTSDFDADLLSLAMDDSVAPDGAAFMENVFLPVTTSVSPPALRVRRFSEDSAATSCATLSPSSSPAPAAPLHILPLSTPRRDEDALALRRKRNREAMRRTRQRERVRLPSLLSWVRVMC